VDKDLSESRGQHVPGLFVGAVTNVGHFVLALESSADSVINTLGLTPVPL
jgi:hypothetical protein